MGSLAQVDIKPNQQQNKSRGYGKTFEPAPDLPALFSLMFADGVFVVRNFGEEVEVHGSPNRHFIVDVMTQGSTIGKAGDSQLYGIDPDLYAQPLSLPEKRNSIRKG